METYIAKKEEEKLYLFKGDEKIGEISPEAGWVKEGDEFDESQLSMIIYYIYGYNGYGEHRGWMDKPEQLIGTNVFVGEPDIGIIKSIRQIIIHLKCPTCSHFH